MTDSLVTLYSSLFQVCKTWCQLLYADTRYWKNVTFVIYYNQFRSQGSPLPAPIAPSTEACSDPNGAHSSRRESINNGNRGTNKATASISTGMASNRMTPNAHLTTDAQEGDGYSCYSSTEPPGALLPNGLTYAWPPPAPTFTSAEQTCDSNGNAFNSKLFTMESSATNATNATFYSGASPPTVSSLGSLDPRTRLFVSLKVRGFDSICLYNATDEDIIELATHPLLNDGSRSEKFTQVSIRHSSITDKGLEVFLASNARYLQSFELIGCNEIADSGLWTGLVPNLKCLSIQDCINISDETIAAICQLLTSLKTLQVQVMCYVLVICC